MIQFKNKPGFTEIVLSDENLYTFEKTVIVNIAHIIRIYKAHSWGTDYKDGNNGLVREYWVEIFSHPHNINYKITEDCYYELDYMLT